jgi:lipoprotein-releasing system ATP-binding protein
METESDFMTEPTTPQASLSCRNLEKYLGNEENLVHVLKKVSLEVFPGRAYSIVGPSGCGKSTLLYLLGLLDRPHGGEIEIGGILTANLNDDEMTELRNNLLGFVFQFHFLIKEFTALENIMLPMKRCGKLTEKEMRALGTHLLNEVGMASKANRRANHLSGGEQQRVAIARALANQPRVLLADEPTGNLDTINSHRVFDLLLRIVHEENLTLLVVTHNPQVAEASDVILEMRDGEFTARTEKDRGAPPVLHTH